MFITGSGLGWLRAAAQSRCTAVRLWKNKNGTLHNACVALLLLPLPRGRGVITPVTAWRRVSGIRK